MMNRKEIERKLDKLIAGEAISKAEKQEILEVLKKENNNKKYFRLMEKLNQEMIFLKQLENINIDKDWEDLQERVQAKYKKDSGKIIQFDYPKDNIWKRKDYLSAIAAVIIILIAIPSILYFTSQNNSYTNKQIISAKGNTEIKLSDGSTVLLRKSSSLTFIEPLHTKKREVKLTGEAWFEIVKKVDAPFYIHLKNSSVKVLGTSFTVKEDNNETVKVNVLTGKVSFYEPGNLNNAIQLEAGEEGVFNNTTGKFTRSKFTSENFLFWKSGKLSFTEQELANVFEELESIFEKKIIVENQEILQTKFTSKFEDAKLEDILHDMGILYNINYNIKNDSVFIRVNH